MIGVTVFGIFLTPVFYYVIQRFSHQTRRANAAPAGGKTREDGEPASSSEK